MSTIKATNWQNLDGVPMNSVIQQATYTTGNTGYSYSVSNAPVSTALAVTITPKKDYSTFYVHLIAGGYFVTNIANGSNVGILRTVSSTTTQVAGNYSGGETAPAAQWMGMFHSMTGGSTSVGAWQRNRHAVDAPNVTAGTPITYTCCLAAWQATGTTASMYLGYSSYGFSPRITVFEIAA